MPWPKNTYLNEKIRKAGNSHKELYAIVKGFTSPLQCQLSTPESQKWADTLASYFKDKIDAIHRTFPNEPIDRVRAIQNEPFNPLNSPCDYKLNKFNPITEEEVNIRLNKAKSGSPNDVASVQILTKLGPALVPIVTNIFNVSLSQATVPSVWKEALIQPILKKTNADPNQSINYRPIALLPLFSKIMEASINAQMTKFLEDNGILDTSQSGFRASHSTETALVEIVDNIRLALDSKQSAILILLDLSAAFDTISHSILLERLEEIGVGGLALSWIKSYLKDRRSRVKIGPFLSDMVENDKGVPQGSILSPTLFNVYLSPLANIIRSFGFDTVSYADDTQILIKWGHNLLDVQTRFSNCMIAINTWMAKNYLMLNTAKTEIMLFGPAKKTWSADWWPNELGQCPMPKETVKNLGILLDDTLSMSPHVNKVVQTSFGIMKSLRKIFRWLPIDCRKPLIQGLIISRLDYGNALLANINEGALTKLQVLQNTAARLTLNLPPRTPSAPTLTKLHWLPVRKRVKFKICCLVHKSVHAQGPAYLKKKLTSYLPTRTLRSADKNLLCVPKVRTVRNGDRSFSKLAPDLWNSLPLSLRADNNYRSFRKSLKTLLF